MSEIQIDSNITSTSDFFIHMKIIKKIIMHIKTHSIFLILIELDYSILICFYAFQ